MSNFGFNKFQMVDCETLGVVGGYAVLSLGAVRFDAFSPWGADGQRIAAADQIKIRISRESNRKYGLKESAKTLAFWAGQTEEAREEAFGGTVDLKVALVAYREWCLDTFGGIVDNMAGYETMDANSYCHGATFDVPMLEWIYDHLEIPSPFPYNRTRDTRSVFELAGVAYKGVSHKVIEDCYGQCAALCRSHDIIGFSRLANRLPGWLLPMEGLAFPVLAN